MLARRTDGHDAVGEGDHRIDPRGQLLAIFGIGLVERHEVQQNRQRKREGDATEIDVKGQAHGDSGARSGAGDAVTSRYCRPPCSYIEGPPLVGPPSGSVASSPPWPVS
mgnify:CR=1 FL=1